MTASTTAEPDVLAHSPVRSSRSLRLLAAVVVAVALAGAAFAVHRDDPIEVEATVVVQRTSTDTATAVSRTIAASAGASISDPLPDGVERIGVARIPNEPTIVAVVEAGDEATAMTELDLVVDELLRLGAVEWAGNLQRRRRDLEATLAELLAAPEPALRLQASVEGDIAQIDEDLAAGGNIVEVVDEGTTRPANRPARDALVIGAVALAAALAAEFLLGRRSTGMSSST